MRLRAVRAILEIRSSTPIYDYTGKITKTLLYTLVREMQLLHGLRGVVSPVVVSPPFTLGKRDMELGDVVSPAYVRRGGGEELDWELKPVALDGEYIIHVGGGEGVVELAAKALSGLRTPLAIKIDDAIVLYRVGKVEDVTKRIEEKAETLHNRVTVYLKSPALIFNVFAPTKLPKFSPSAVEVLMTPYMLYHGIQTLDYKILLDAAGLLGQLVETWYSLNTLKPTMIPFRGKREAALTGYITYIVEARGQAEREAIAKVLAAAEIAGVGESRQNGFGVAAFKQK